jgi:hypothetical protein
MRRLIFFCFIVLGTLTGLLSAAEDDWATRAVMAAIGALVGAAVGGGLTRVGSKSLPKQPLWLDNALDQSSPEDELVRNYWRDRGHPPFAKPPEALLTDRHAFDLDKSG